MNESHKDDEELDVLNSEEVEEEEPESEEIEESEEESEELEESESEEEEPESKSEEPEEEDGFFIQIGEEEVKEIEKETPVIKQIRNANRKLAKEKAELEKKLAELNKPDPKVALGKKPELDDFDFDEVKFEEALLQWHERKRHVDEEHRKQQEQIDAANRAWSQKVSNYSDAKSRVKNDDFEAVESFVMENLSQEQQSWIISSSDNAVRDVYLLGKLPDDLKRLSEQKDPARFIYELAKLNVSKGAKMKSKSTPSPEKRVKGTAPRKSAIDAKLKRLEEEAARTGDRSKLIQYKRALKK